MAFEFTFSRRVGAGSTYAPNNSAICQQSEAWYEVECILSAADRQDPRVDLEVRGLFSPDGVNWQQGGGIRFQGTTSCPPELLAEWLAVNPWTSGQLPPAGWYVKAQIINHGTVAVTADYRVIIHDGDRSSLKFVRGRNG